MGYTRLAIKGVTWIASLRYVTRILTLLRISILARIFTPLQFGIYGIASLALSLIEILSETGINVFLIQRKDNTEKYINTAWIVSIIRGLVISIVIFILSPLFISFFDLSGYFHLFLIISLIPLVKGFINPAIIFYQKDLKFRKEFYLRLIVFVVESIVTIILALITRQIYSIALGMLVGAFTEVFLSFKFASPRPAFRYEGNLVKEILHRGKWITVSGIFNYFFHNSPDMIIGKILGASSLGLYQMAYKISIFPITEVSDVVSKVVFPVYSKIGLDKTRLKKAFLKTFVLISAISILFGAFLFTFTREAVLLVLGDKWIDILPFLKVLILFGIVRGISGSTSALFFALNKQEYVSVVTFVSFLALIVTIFPLVLAWGLIGVSFSILISSIIVLPFMIYYTHKLLYE